MSPLLQGALVVTVLALHSMEFTKKKVTELFRCFLGLSKLSVICYVHLVPNIEVSEIISEMIPVIIRY